MKKKTNNLNAMKLTVLGASLAGVAATAYFFFGPKGKKHQRHAKAWAIKMKGDVVEKLKAARKVTEPVYHEIIDSVAKEYSREMKAGRSEVTALAKDLKKHWKTISEAAKSVKAEVVKGASKVIKKARS